MNRAAGHWTVAVLLAVALIPSCGNRSNHGTRDAGMDQVSTGGTSGGAGGQTGGAGGGGSDGTGGGTAQPCAGGATLVYVVRSIATMGSGKVVDGGVTQEVFGFNLDGRYSDGTQVEDCRRTDDVSSDGRRGIDNTIAGAWMEDFSRAFDVGLADGSVVMTIRLSGVDSFEDDSCVDITWSADVPQWRRARIEAGRVLAEGSGVAAIRGKGFNSGGVAVPIDFPMSAPRIAFRATPEALAGGIVGGTMTVAQMVGNYKSLFGFITEDVVLGVIFPDLPGTDGNPCAHLSAGFGFDAQAVPTTL